MPTSKTKVVVIDFQDYCEVDTNDPKEMRTAKVEGPLYTLPSGKTVRIPRSGWVEEGLEFRLQGGFHRTVERPRTVLAIPTEVTEWLKKWLGPAYVFSWKNRMDLQGAMVAALKRQSWPEIKRELTVDRERGKLKSLQEVLLGTPEKESGPEPTPTPSLPDPPGAEISDSRLREMGLL